MAEANRAGTAVSEDAPQWFRAAGVDVLANMRPAFDPHAHESKRWDKSDTAVSANGPAFMSGPFSAFWRTPEFAHANFIVRQHTPRSRVQNASHAHILLGAVGPRGQAERLSSATRFAANALRSLPAGHLHEGRRQELNAALAKAQVLLTCGHVPISDGPRQQPRAAAHRPLSAPADTYVARAASLGVHGRGSTSALRSFCPPSAGGSSGSQLRDALPARARPGAPHRPSTAPARGSWAHADCASSSLARIGEKAMAWPAVKALPAARASYGHGARPNLALRRAAAAAAAAAADVALVRSLRAPATGYFDPVIHASPHAHASAPR
ncbi:hypothetical protein KFE25_005959 [Diacronema lutheri]|uniref:Uncharacterized protein n=1 Tax=Diacronema lutheri TaxID=2081491 RepID=A0A8J5Y185_DIALT|nr:hypothetical protein KFE25_005959 [Diacronema lutheri]